MLDTELFQMIAEIGANKWKRTLRTEQDFLRLFGFIAIANAPKNERRERDLNPRDPHGSQAGRFDKFQACALPG